MKNIVLSGFSNVMIECLTLVLKDVYSMDISVMPQNENSSIENELGNLLLIHSNGAYPESQAVALIRELRKSGCIIPVIVLGFSRKNVHRVFFNEKAHKYFTYPVNLKELQIEMKTIKALTRGEVKGFYKRVFCDKEYLKTLIPGIRHDVKNCNWSNAVKRIEVLTSCIGKKTTKIIQQLADEKKDWEENKSKWEAELKVLAEVINGL